MSSSFDVFKRRGISERSKIITTSILGERMKVKQEQQFFKAP